MLENDPAASVWPQFLFSQHGKAPAPRVQSPSDRFILLHGSSCSEECSSDSVDTFFGWRHRKRSSRWCVASVLALGSRGLARSRVATTWMGDRFVLGFACRLWLWASFPAVEILCWPYTSQKFFGWDYKPKSRRVCTYACKKEGAYVFFFSGGWGVHVVVHVKIMKKKKKTQTKKTKTNLHAH